MRIKENERKCLSGRISRHKYSRLISEMIVWSRLQFENFLILKFKYIFEKLSLMWFLLIYVAQVQTALRLSSNWVLLMTTPYFVFWKRRNGEKENL